MNDKSVVQHIKSEKFPYRTPVFKITPKEINFVNTTKQTSKVRLLSCDFNSNYYNISFNNNVITWLRKVRLDLNEIVMNKFPDNINPINPYMNVPIYKEQYHLCQLYISPNQYKDVEEILYEANYRFNESFKSIFDMKEQTIKSFDNVKLKNNNLYNIDGVLKIFDTTSHNTILYNDNKVAYIIDGEFVYTNEDNVTKTLVNPVVELNSITDAIITSAEIINPKFEFDKFTTYVEDDITYISNSKLSNLSNNDTYNIVNSFNLIKNKTNITIYNDDEIINDDVYINKANFVTFPVIADYNKKYNNINTELKLELEVIHDEQDYAKITKGMIREYNYLDKVDLIGDLLVDNDIRLYYDDKSLDKLNNPFYFVEDSEGLDKYTIDNIEEVVLEESDTVNIESKTLSFNNEQKNIEILNYISKDNYIYVTSSEMNPCNENGDEDVEKNLLYRIIDFNKTVNVEPNIDETIYITKNDNYKVYYNGWLMIVHGMYIIKEDNITICKYIVVDKNSLISQDSRFKIKICDKETKLNSLFDLTTNVDSLNLSYNYNSNVFNTYNTEQFKVNDIYNTNIKNITYVPFGTYTKINSLTNDKEINKTYMFNDIIDSNITYKVTSIDNRYIDKGRIINYVTTWKETKYKLPNVDDYYVKSNNDYIKVNIVINNIFNNPELYYESTFKYDQELNPNKVFSYYYEIYDGIIILVDQKYSYTSTTNQDDKGNWLELISSVNDIITDTNSNVINILSNSIRDIVNTLNLSATPTLVEFDRKNKYRRYTIFNTTSDFTDAKNKYVFIGKTDEDKTIEINYIKPNALYNLVNTYTKKDNNKYYSYDGREFIVNCVNDYNYKDELTLYYNSNNYIDDNGTILFVYFDNELYVSNISPITLTRIHKYKYIEYNHTNESYYMYNNKYITYYENNINNTITFTKRDDKFVILPDEINKYTITYENGNPITEDTFIATKTNKYVDYTTLDKYMLKTTYTSDLNNQSNPKLFKYDNNGVEYDRSITYINKITINKNKNINNMWYIVNGIYSKEIYEDNTVQRSTGTLQIGDTKYNRIDKNELYIQTLSISNKGSSSQVIQGNYDLIKDDDKYYIFNNGNRYNKNFIHVSDKLVDTNDIKYTYDTGYYKINNIYTKDVTFMYLHENLPKYNGTLNNNNLIKIPYTYINVNTKFNFYNLNNELVYSDTTLWYILHNNIKDVYVNINNNKLLIDLNNIVYYGKDYKQATHYQNYGDNEYKEITNDTPNNVKYFVLNNGEYIKCDLVKQNDKYYNSSINDYYIKYSNNIYSIAVDVTDNAVYYKLVNNKLVNIKDIKYSYLRDELKDISISTIDETYILVKDLFVYPNDNTYKITKDDSTNIIDDQYLQKYIKLLNMKLFIGDSLYTTTNILTTTTINSNISKLNEGVNIIIASDKTNIERVYGYSNYERLNNCDEMGNTTETYYMLDSKEYKCINKQPNRYTDGDLHKNYYKFKQYIFRFDAFIYNEYGAEDVYKVTTNVIVNNPTVTINNEILITYVDSYNYTITNVDDAEINYTNHIIKIDCLTYNIIKSSELPSKYDEIVDDEYVDGIYVIDENNSRIIIVDETNNKICFINSSKVALLDYTIELTAVNKYKYKFNGFIYDYTIKASNEETLIVNSSNIVDIVRPYKVYPVTQFTIPDDKELIPKECAYVENEGRYVNKKDMLKCDRLGYTEKIWYYTNTTCYLTIDNVNRDDLIYKNQSTNYVLYKCTPIDKRINWYDNNIKLIVRDIYTNERINDEYTSLTKDITLTYNNEINKYMFNDNIVNIREIIETNNIINLPQIVTFTYDDIDLCYKYNNVKYMLYNNNMEFNNVYIHNNRLISIKNVFNEDIIDTSNIISVEYDKLIVDKTITTLSPTIIYQESYVKSLSEATVYNDSVFNNVIKEIYSEQYDLIPNVDNILHNQFKYILSNGKYIHETEFNNIKYKLAYSNNIIDKLSTYEVKVKQVITNDIECIFNSGEYYFEDRLITFYTLNNTKVKPVNDKSFTIKYDNTMKTHVLDDNYVYIDVDYKLNNGNNELINDGSFVVYNVNNTPLDISKLLINNRLTIKFDGKAYLVVTKPTLINSNEFIEVNNGEYIFNNSRYSYSLPFAVSIINKPTYIKYSTNRYEINYNYVKTNNINEATHFNISHTLISNMYEITDEYINTNSLSIDYTLYNLYNKGVNNTYRLVNSTWYRQINNYTLDSDGEYVKFPQSKHIVSLTLNTINHLCNNFGILNNNGDHLIFKFNELNESEKLYINNPQDYYIIQIDKSKIINNTYTYILDNDKYVKYNKEDKYDIVNRYIEDDNGIYIYLDNKYIKLDYMYTKSDKYDFVIDKSRDANKYYKHKSFDLYISDSNYTWYFHESTYTEDSNGEYCKVDSHLGLGDYIKFSDKRGPLIKNSTYSAVDPTTSETLTRYIKINDKYYEYKIYYKCIVEKKDEDLELVEDEFVALLNIEGKSSVTNTLYNIDVKCILNTTTDQSKDFDYIILNGIYTKELMIRKDCLPVNVLIRYNDKEYNIFDYESFDNNNSCEIIYKGEDIEANKLISYGNVTKEIETKTFTNLNNKLHINEIIFDNNTISMFNYDDVIKDSPTKNLYPSLYKDNVTYDVFSNKSVGDHQSFIYSNDINNKEFIDETLVYKTNYSHSYCNKFMINVETTGVDRIKDIIDKYEYKYDYTSCNKYLHKYLYISDNKNVKQLPMHNNKYYSTQEQYNYNFNVYITCNNFTVKSITTSIIDNIEYTVTVYKDNGNNGIILSNNLYSTKLSHLFGTTDMKSAEVITYESIDSNYYIFTITDNNDYIYSRKQLGNLLLNESIKLGIHYYSFVIYIYNTINNNTTNDKTDILTEINENYYMSYMESFYGLYENTLNLAGYVYHTSYIISNENIISETNKEEKIYSNKAICRIDISYITFINTIYNRYNIDLSTFRIVQPIDSKAFSSEDIKSNILFNIIPLNISEEKINKYVLDKTLVNDILDKGYYIQTKIDSINIIDKIDKNNIYTSSYYIDNILGSYIYYNKHYIHSTNSCYIKSYIPNINKDIYLHMNNIMKDEAAQNFENKINNGSTNTIDKRYIKVITANSYISGDESKASFLLIKSNSRYKKLFDELGFEKYIYSNDDSTYCNLKYLNKCESVSTIKYTTNIYFNNKYKFMDASLGVRTYTTTFSINSDGNDLTYDENYLPGSVYSFILDIDGYKSIKTINLNLKPLYLLNNNNNVKLFIYNNNEPVLNNNINLYIDFKLQLDASINNSFKYYSQSNSHYRIYDVKIITTTVGVIFTRIINYDNNIDIINSYDEIMDLFYNQLLFNIGNNINTYKNDLTVTRRARIGEFVLANYYDMYVSDEIKENIYSKTDFIPSLNNARIVNITRVQEEIECDIEDSHIELHKFKQNYIKYYVPNVLGINEIKYIHQLNNCKFILMFDYDDGNVDHNNTNEYNFADYPLDISKATNVKVVINNTTYTAVLHNSISLVKYYNKSTNKYYGNVVDKMCYINNITFNEIDISTLNISSTDNRSDINTKIKDLLESKNYNINNVSLYHNDTIEQNNDLNLYYYYEYSGSSGGYITHIYSGDIYYMIPFKQFNIPDDNKVYKDATNVKYIDINDNLVDRNINSLYDNGIDKVTGSVMNDIYLNINKSNFIINTRDVKIIKPNMWEHNSYKQVFYTTGCNVNNISSTIEKNITQYNDENIYNGYKDNIRYICNITNYGGTNQNIQNIFIDNDYITYPQTFTPEKTSINIYDDVLINKKSLLPYNRLEIVVNKVVICRTYDEEKSLRNGQFIHIYNTNNEITLYSKEFNIIRDSIDEYIRYNDIYYIDSAFNKITNLYSHGYNNNIDGEYYKFKRGIVNDNEIVYNESIERLLSNYTPPFVSLTVVKSGGVFKIKGEEDMIDIESDKAEFDIILNHNDHYIKIKDCEYMYFNKECDKAMNIDDLSFKFNVTTPINNKFSTYNSQNNDISKYNNITCTCKLDGNKLYLSNLHYTNCYYDNENVGEQVTKKCLKNLSCEMNKLYYVYNNTNYVKLNNKFSFNSNNALDLSKQYKLKNITINTLYEIISAFLIYDNDNNYYGIGFNSSEQFMINYYLLHYYINIETNNVWYDDIDEIDINLLNYINNNMYKLENYNNGYRDLNTYESSPELYNNNSPYKFIFTVYDEMVNYASNDCTINMNVSNYNMFNDENIYPMDNKCIIDTFKHNSDIFPKVINYNILNSSFTIRPYKYNNTYIITIDINDEPIYVEHNNFKFNIIAFNNNKSTNKTIMYINNKCLTISNCLIKSSKVKESSDKLINYSEATESSITTNEPKNNIELLYDSYFNKIRNNISENKNCFNLIELYGEPTLGLDFTFDCMPVTCNTEKSKTDSYLELIKSPNFALDTLTLKLENVINYNNENGLTNNMYSLYKYNKQLELIDDYYYNFTNDDNVLNKLGFNLPNIDINDSNTYVIKGKYYSERVYNGPVISQHSYKYVETSTINNNKVQNKYIVDKGVNLLTIQENILNKYFIKSQHFADRMMNLSIPSNVEIMITLSEDVERILNDKDTHNLSSYIGNYNVIRPNDPIYANIRQNIPINKTIDIADKTVYVYITSEEQKYPLINSESILHVEYIA